jgi:hypothetical protein
VPSRGENEGDVEKIVHGRGRGEREEIADERVTLFQFIGEAARGEVVVGGEPGMRKPGEDSEVDEGGDGSEGHIFDELHADGGTRRPEPAQGGVDPILAVETPDRAKIGE